MGFSPEDRVMLQNIKGKKIHANIGNRGLTDRQVSKILEYLRDEVYYWCRRHPGDAFSVHQLFGGEKGDWNGTPLQDCYYHREETSSDPVKAAGVDCGFLLRRMLQDDKRTYRQTSKTRPGQHYKLIPSKRRK